MTNQNYPNIPKEKLRFVGSNRQIHDVKLDTKPVGYFKDAFRRFCKNKSSIVAAIIIILQLLFALIVPLCSPYTVEDRFGDYDLVLPSLSFTRENNIKFWDGRKTEVKSQSGFDLLYAIGEEYRYVNDTTENRAAIVEYTQEQLTDTNGVEYTSYSMYVDSYYKVGFVYRDLTEKEYLALQEYQNETGIQVIYPLQKNNKYVGANYWYKLDEYNQTLLESSLEVGKLENVAKALSAGVALRYEDGSYVNNYLTSVDPNAYNYNSIKLDFEGTSAAESKTVLTDAPVREDLSSEAQYPIYFDSIGNRYYWYSDKVGYAVELDGTWKKAQVIDGKVYSTDGSEELTTKPLYYCYAFKNQTGYRVRVNYYEYFKYVEGHYPNFVFGTNKHGQDIFSCLASGARLSFLLAICVCAVNFTIGAIYGAIEGYYGGALDLVMERFSDILASVPGIVVNTLFQLHLASKVGVVGCLIFAFVLTGWIGMAGRVRMQFYRFKSQEYVLAARTLGASDNRIIWKHIFPNTLGTIITGSVLAIPGVIFSESMLSYLGIVNLETTSVTSIGTLLSQGSGLLKTYPHAIFFPALFIALLEICFNLFGNGLRDAFNPTLRGAEE